MHAEGVLVAAGRSSRMSLHNKLLMMIEGRSLIQRTIDHLRPFTMSIIIVTGHQSDTLISHLKDQSNLRFVYNPDHLTHSMFASVLIGLSNVTKEYAFLLPADMPLIDPEVYKKLMSRHQGIVVPTYQGSSGHPVLLRKDMIDQLLQSPNYPSLRHFIQAHHHQKVEVEDPHILLDVDTPLDLERIRSIYRHKLKEVTHGTDQ